MNSSHGQGQLARDEVEILALGNVVHPANGIGDLGRLLARRPGCIHDGLPFLDLWHDHGVSVAYRFAESGGVRKHQVNQGSCDGRCHAHDKRQSERVDRKCLRDVEPSSIPAESRAEEYSRRHACNDFEEVLSNYPRCPFLALAKDIIDGADRLVYKIACDQAQRLRQLNADCISEEEAVSESLFMGLEARVVDEKILPRLVCNPNQE